MRRLRQSGGGDDKAIIEAGVPGEIASIIIQKDGKREDKVYSGTVVIGVRYPGSHIKGEASPLIECLTKQQECHVRCQVAALVAMVRSMYMQRQLLAAQADADGKKVMAHAIRSMPIKHAVVICWGKDSKQRFAIVAERRNHDVNGFCHGRLVIFATSAPIGAEKAECLGNVQFLNKAGNDITMSVVACLVGQTSCFLPERNGVATVATEQVAETTTLPPFEVAEATTQAVSAPLIPMTEIELTEAPIDPVTQEPEQSDVISVKTPAMPLLMQSAESADFSSNQDRASLNANMETSDVPIDPEHIMFEGAIIDGTLDGQKTATVVPISISEPAVVSATQTGGRRSQAGGNFHHPSFGFSTYHPRS